MVPAITSAPPTMPPSPSNDDPTPDRPDLPRRLAGGAGLGRLLDGLLLGGEKIRRGAHRAPRPAPAGESSPLIKQLLSGNGGRPKRPPPGNERPLLLPPDSTPEPRRETCGALFCPGPDSGPRLSISNCRSLFTGDSGFLDRQQSGTALTSKLLVGHGDRRHV